MGLFSSLFANRQANTAVFPRVIVIGMDGLSPDVLEPLMKAGELPHFKALADAGGYRRLGTCLPPESPVAWMTIATGKNPGEHGIFDFMHRDAKTYLPYLSLRKTRDGILGTKYERPSSQNGFWRAISDAGFPTTVIRWPVTFPAEQVKGRFLSGFGVPDLTGGEGKYYFYSTAAADNDPSPRNRIRVEWDGDCVHTHIPGPYVSSTTQANAEMRIRKVSADSLEIEIGGSKAVAVRVGEWSAWVKVGFPVPLRKVHGQVKFFLSEMSPVLKLTASPVHLDSARPEFSMACPDCFPAELESKIGAYHTLGMPEQIHPLSHGRYDYAAFIQECRQVMRERRAMLGLELDRNEKGLLAFVFDTSDRIQHAFWALQDPAHPAFDAAAAREYGGVINDAYREMDEVLGEVLKRAGNDSVVLALSDHGFTSFKRAVHMNRWLIENGYMVLKDPQGRQLFQDVDWSRTRAYSIGFSSIYINLRNREAQGIVDEAQAQVLKTELAGKLQGWLDGQESIVHAVYPREEVYSGAYVKDAPDLIVGLKPGYRFSWQTALGGAPAELLEVNAKKWSGDHLVDPSFVPGVVFCNRPITVSDPSLIHIAPTILHLFGLNKSAKPGLFNK